MNTVGVRLNSVPRRLLYLNGSSSPCQFQSFLGFQNLVKVETRDFHMGQPCSAGYRWRRTLGLPGNISAGGPLKDKPDYSFLSGKPTEIPPGRMKKIIKQRELTKTIIELSAEMDYGIQKHDELTEEERERKRRIIAEKFRAKAAKYNASIV